MKNFTDPSKGNKNLKRCGYTVGERNINMDERSLVGYATTKDVNSYNYALLPDGWELSRFNKNPIMPWNHDYRVQPVGRAAWTKADNYGLKFKGIFASTQFAGEIFQLYVDEVLNAFSVGFTIDKYVEPGNEQFDRLLFDWQIDGQPEFIGTHMTLFEISPVIIPANAGAVVTMLKQHRINDATTVEMIRGAAVRDTLGGDLYTVCLEELDRLNPDRKELYPGADINSNDVEISNNELEQRCNDLFAENDVLKNKVADLEASINYLDGCVLSIIKHIKKITPKKNAPEISANQLPALIGNLVSGEIRKRQGKID